MKAARNTLKGIGVILLIPWGVIGFAWYWAWVARWLAKPIAPLVMPEWTDEEDEAYD